MSGGHRLSYRSQVHVNAARKTRIKTTNRSHNIDAFEVFRAVLFKDWRVLHRIFIWSRRAIDIARIGIPRRRRIRMIVCDFAVANHHVMREHAAYGFMEPAADGLIGNFEIRKVLVLPSCSSLIACSAK